MRVFNPSPGWRAAGYIFLAGMTTGCASDPTHTPSAMSPRPAAPSDDNQVVHVPPGSPFYVYWDQGSILNHFTPSGWMGDFRDLRMDQTNTDHPPEGGGQTSIQFIYSGEGKQGNNWAGIYWQEPANNWGSKPGGVDLTGMTKLVFQARGAQGGERIASFKMGGITGTYGDSGSAEIGPVDLTSDWKTYTIDLSSTNLSHVVGGFAWVASRDDNPKGLTLYLDDIRYEP